MDRSQFSAGKSGRLIKAGPANVAYWAFVPNPLPPTLHLNLTLIQALSAADRALGELGRAGT